MKQRVFISNAIDEEKLPFISAEEINFALRQSLHQGNEGIGASAGGLGPGPP